MLKLAAFLSAVMLVSAAATSARAAEHRIGDKPIVEHGMIVSVVYLQSVHMASEMTGMDQLSDIHLEANIHADKGNAQGFPPGAWIPYLTITYLITKQGSDWSVSGRFRPMTANNGPHYGANARLDGPGKYHLSFRILPPPSDALMLHADKETGVAEWWKPFTVAWDFVYVGVGKKGGY